ncbi:MAG TPA: PqqD family protein [Ignavibacteria bacterium]|nr:PqqD family protein [Ignavibacteria bacterium]
MFKKKQNIIYNYLDFTPCRNQEFTVDDGIVKLVIPKFKSNFMKSLIPSRKSQNYKVKLDEIGSEVWLLIDGENRVSDIAAKLREKLGGRIEPAEERITKFLTDLHYQKFIYFKELKKETKNG